MKFQIGMKGDIVVLGLSGDLTAASADELTAKVKELTAKGFNYLILKMNGVGFMDSSGLGVCVAIHKMLASSGQVVFCELSPKTAKVFRLTHADKRLNMADTEAEAVQLILEKR